MIQPQQVLITGASRGIGKAIARMLHDDKGFNVTGTSRFPGDCEGPIPLIALDLTNPQSIQDLVKEIPNPDIVVLNAGQSQFGPAESTPVDRVRQLFDLNLFGNMELIRHYLPIMRQRRSGMIIAIGSLTGEFPLPYFSGYVASKFALRGYIRSLRNEMAGFGVSVVLVEPNDIRTSIEPEMHVDPDSEYGPTALKAREKLRRNMARAHSPEVVARLIWHILQMRNPMPVYPIGGPAKTLVAIERILPNFMTDFLLRKMYGL